MNDETDKTSVVKSDAFFNSITPIDNIGYEINQTPIDNDVYDFKETTGGKNYTEICGETNINIHEKIDMVHLKSNYMYLPLDYIIEGIADFCLNNENPEKELLLIITKIQEKMKK